MTETLVLTPSQTIGPYVSIGLFNEHMVPALVSDDESLEAALEWLRESYWLRAPEHLRHAVEADD